MSVVMEIIIVNKFVSTTLVVTPVTALLVFIWTVMAIIAQVYFQILTNS